MAASTPGPMRMTIVFAPSGFASRGPAISARTLEINRLQREALRVQREIATRNLSSQSVTDARLQLRAAHAELATARENALVAVRKGDAYQTLRGQLWQGTEVVTSLHGAVPPDQEQILERSRHNLQIRRSLTRLETDVLDADPDVLFAREALADATQKYLRAVRIAQDEVRNDPRMAETSLRLRRLRAGMNG